MEKKPQVFRMADIRHRKESLGENGTYIKPFVTVKNSESMAVGVNFPNKVPVSFCLPCGELSFCHQGKFRSVVGGGG